MSTFWTVAKFAGAAYIIVTGLMGLALGALVLQCHLEEKRNG